MVPSSRPNIAMDFDNTAEIQRPQRERRPLLSICLSGLWTEIPDAALGPRVCFPIGATTEAPTSPSGFGSQV